jgi:predicted SAM-dependent methyltransferase
LPFGNRAFAILRYELNAGITTTLNVISPRMRRLHSQLAKRQHVNLNLGTGGRGVADWVNIDVARHHQDLTLPWDIRRGLPFSDGQVARIFAEHIVEHIEFREDIPRLMREFFRVLEPGGRVRLIVPDGERWLHAYVTRSPDEWQGLGFSDLPPGMPTPMTMINHVFHQDGEHFFGYDYETLKYVLEQAGFHKIGKAAYQVSADPQLCLDRDEHAKYSLYVEAQK